MTDRHLSPSDRPLPTRLGLCEPIPQTDEQIDADLRKLTERGAVAWADVSDPTAWVDELRGTAEPEPRTDDAYWSLIPFYCRDCDHEWTGASVRSDCPECGNERCGKGDRRRIVIDGVRYPWSEDERRIFLAEVHQGAQAGRFAE